MCDLVNNSAAEGNLEVTASHAMFPKPGDCVQQHTWMVVAMWWRQLHVQLHQSHDLTQNVRADQHDALDFISSNTIHLIHLTAHHPTTLRHYRHNGTTIPCFHEQIFVTQPFGFRPRYQ